MTGTVHSWIIDGYACNQYMRLLSLNVKLHQMVSVAAGCMAASTDGRILVWGGYSKTSVKKEIDRGVTHSDMFAMVPESECFSLYLFLLPVKLILSFL